MRGLSRCWLGESRLRNLLLMISLFLLGRLNRAQMLLIQLLCDNFLSAVGHCAKQALLDVGFELALLANRDL